MRSILQDLGKKSAMGLLSDASAVFGIIRHQGLGRLRHIDCELLYVQKLDAEKVFEFTTLCF